MSTKKNGVTSASATSAKKSARSTTKKSVNSKRANKVKESLAASVSVASSAAASAAASSASASDITAAAAAAVPSSVAAAAVGAGVAAAASVPSGRSSVVASAVMDSDIKIIELRNKIASRWAAPRFEDSEEYNTISALAAAIADEDLKQGIINGARLKWLARPENVALIPSIEEVVNHIKDSYKKEFENVCGCPVPAVDRVRNYSYTSLSVSTITPDSLISDYVYSSPVVSGASAAAVVSAVMSYRVYVDVMRRRNAARAARRNEYKEYMAGAARKALALHIDSAVAARYLSYIMRNISVNDRSDEKRLKANLSRCWVSLRQIENSIVLAGGRGAIEDLCGGWCFPAAGLAAVLPAGASASASVRAAKVRKLWARRERVLSSINTLNMMLAR